MAREIQSVGRLRTGADKMKALSIICKMNLSFTRWLSIPLCCTGLLRFLHIASAHNLFNTAFAWTNMKHLSVAHACLLCACLLSLSGEVPALTPQEAPMIVRAAERGSQSAQVMLAVMYRDGDAGFPHDDKQAAHWFELAALQGNSYAQQVMGESYSNGRGVPVNLKIAADWFEKAAKRGNIQAQVALGTMYLDGKGVAADAQQAAYWLGRAADHGNSEAEYLLGRMYRNGKHIAANPAMANDLLARSAAQGYTDAIRFIQTIENFGYEIDEDLHQGPARLEQLATDGDAEAAYQLAMRYENAAYGVQQDNAKALYWFKKAAENGSVPAMTSLADIYAKGLLGVKVDLVASQAWNARSKRH